MKLVEETQKYKEDTSHMRYSSSTSLEDWDDGWDDRLVYKHFGKYSDGDCLVFCIYFACFLTIFIVGAICMIIN